MLGGFALDGASGPASALPKRRAEAVLAALAVRGDLGCTRERLVALLWPESDDPIRGDPRYRALLAKYGGRVAVTALSP